MKASSIKLYEYGLGADLLSKSEEGTGATDILQGDKSFLPVT